MVFEHPTNVFVAGFIGTPYGTKVFFTFPGSQVHLFARDTEENLI